MSSKHPEIMPSDEIINRLQVVDPDRLRAAQLADKQQRMALLTLYGFHAELAKVPEIVSEPMIGNIRYQWWRDVLGEIYNDKPVRAHELNAAFAPLCQQYGLPRYWLDKLIDGRERDLDPTPFGNIDEAREYARATSGVLAQLATHILDCEFDSDRAANIGQVWGMVGLCRAYRYHHGNMLSELAFGELLSATKGDYIKVRGKLPAEVMPALAYAATSKGFLKRLSVPELDPKSQEISYSVPFKQLRLLGASFKGRI